MAERNAIMPGPRTPIVDSRGRLDPTWYRFLVDLYERTGGGAEDKVEEGATGAATAQAAAATAQTAANTAQTAANTAQSLADDLERRLDFDIDFDIQ